MDALLALAPEMDFLAIDFETATHMMASACAIGFAAVKDGRVAASAQLFIQPPGNRYSPFNIDIHGIYPEHTEFCPAFPELWPEISPLFARAPLLAHNARFDMAVLLGSLGPAVAALVPDFSFYDTVQMAKSIVPGRRNLKACCTHFGIDLHNHHDAEADAIACAEVAIACLRHYEAEDLKELSRLAPGVRAQHFHGFATRSAAY